ncbi:2OG-Fe(II) oxygenase [Cupriavidus basilensis]|uniref:2OG-Fe(II) oxygenase n=1 Tax=Cupriavidus basilensis TaxID=68895 RepID=A0ABT6ARZ4_9BURK|nr:2OG-Fe(II) oxygenase [Cupriavidus basilensis]MDF3835224.1 2OG-Fe(II) oxygenase [Cupriavidus basilensis]
MSALETLFAALEEQGWAVSDELVDPALVARLYRDSRAAWEGGLFHQARIGRGQEAARDPDIRGDSILWLDDAPVAGATQDFQAWAAGFRQALNARYYLGLKREEFHFSHYPVGTAYKKHLDQHRATEHRKISLVLYLNPEWEQHDGGELVLYPPDGQASALRQVLPQCARLAVFRSDLIPHEVLPCRRTRWALTGWFRTDPA